MGDERETYMSTLPFFGARKYQRHDPEHLATMTHFAVEALRARLRNSPGFNYLGRIKAAIASGGHLPPDTVEALSLDADIRTLRELADELQVCRDLLTGRRQLEPIKIAAE